MSSSHSAPTLPAAPAGAKTIQVSLGAPASTKAGADAVVQALIDKGYVPARQLIGKVVGTWGDVMVRDAEGHVRSLNAGDVVEKGDVVLTGQDGIVQIESGRAAAAPSELERVIAEVAAGNPEAAPAAGAQGGDGSMQPGLRVDRVAEDVTPASIGTEPLGAPRSNAVVDDAMPMAATPAIAASPDTVTVAEDAAVTFDPRSNDDLAGASPVAVLTLGGQAIAVGNPVILPQGTVTLNPDGTLTFTPAPDFNGTFSVPYTASNGSGTVSSTITVTVTPVGDAPNAADDTNAAANDALVTPEDTPTIIDVLGNDADPDGDPLTITAIDGQPIRPGTPVPVTDGAGQTVGTVNLNPDGTLTFTPAPNYHGPADFDYTMTDGTTPVTAHVTVTVTPVNDAPLAVSDTFNAAEDAAFNGDLGRNDQFSGDGAHTFALATGPTHGTVVVNADGTFTYTPAANYSGPDSFTYTLTDADGDVSIATVTLNVGAVDDLPVAVNDTFAAAEDTALSGNLGSNDTLSGDGGNSFALATGPAHGTVVVNADGTFTYTPSANYNGPDSFTYTLTDADGDVSTATVTLNVNSVDDLPIAANDTFVATEDTVLSGNLGSNDTLSGDGGNTFALATGPSHGTVTVNADGTFIYTPAANYNGPDSFTYRLTDADGDVSTATVTLNVGAVDDLPVAVNDTFAATEDTLLNGSLAGNDTLSGDGGNSFAVGTGPAHGSVVVNADGTFTYTPSANYNGPDSFTYTLTDADGDVSTATVTLNVGAVDDLPVAVNDTFAADEDTALSGNLGSNDTLSGDGGNAFALATGPAHGTVVVNADGTFTYTPSANFNGPDSFTYTLTDADGDVSTATVSLNVGTSDDLPVAINDTFAATEDTVLNGSLGSNDTLSGDGGNAFALSTGPAHGSVVVNADGTFTYTPAANYNGPDSFTYTLTDADGDVSTATVTLNVGAVDDLPVAVNDTFAAAEDTTLSGNLGSNDTLSGDGGNAFALATGPAHGSVVVNTDGTFTYTPASNYNGPDSFTYTLTDADGDVSTATVTLNVGPADDLPVAANDTFAATEDATVSGSMAGNDTLSGDGGNSFALGTGPSHGTVVVNEDGTFTYTPAANYNGPDSFTYTLTDADGDVSTATVTLNVGSVDDLPVAVNDTFVASEDSAISGILGSNDSLSGDGGNSFALGTGPAHGTVVVNADGTFTYTPSANYNGPDSFTYTLTDADGDVSTATVTLNVVPADDLPVAVNDTFAASEDTALTGNLGSNDTLSGDGGNAFALATGPAHGTVVVNADGTFTYTPAANYNGPDSFTYTLTDADGDISTATVTLNVGAVDDLPVAVNDTFAAAEDTTLSGNLGSNDTMSGDGGNSFALATGPSHGTVLVNADGTFTYTPSANYNGPDSFTYTLTDADGDVSTATVTLNVGPADDLPVAANDTFAATEDATVSGSMAGNDTLSGDGGNSFALGTGPSHGTVVVNEDGTFTYTPAANYNGPDSFTYTLTDADGDVSTATVTLNVGAVDDLPVAVNDTFAATEDTLLNGSLAGNDTLSGDGGNSFAVGTGPAHGSVVVNADGTFTYTPSANYNGPDSFTYTLTDADGDVSTATVTLNVGPADDLPVAANDTFTATEDTTVSGSLAGNDTLSGDGGNAFALGASPAHGTVVVNTDGTFTYTPAANYSGPDSFTYTLTDADGDVSTATVTLNVGPTDDLPVAANDTFVVTEDASVSGSLAGNDTLSGDGGNAFALATGPAHGTVVVNADGTFTYTPAANYNGPDSFTYTLTDADGDVSTATVTLNVGAVDDLPVAVNDTFVAAEDTTLSGNLGSNDTLSGDGGNAFALATGPAHGSVVVNTDGTFTYTPVSNYNGPDSFTYTLTDADGDVSTATVTLNVGSVDDLPVAVNDTFVASEDSAISGILGSNDSLSGDGGNSFALGTGPAHGTVVVNADGTFTYTPSANYNGPDSFTYTLTDADGDVSTATVTLNVGPADDLPVAANDTFAAAEDTPVSGSLAGNDTLSGDGGNSFALGTGPAHGTVVVNADGTFTYTPAANYNGPDSFTYTLTDADGDVSTATVTLNVGPADDLPVAVNDSFAASEDTALTGNLGSNDALSGDGGNAFALATGPAHGTALVNADGTFTYTPSSNYNGPDSFTYTLTDADGDVSIATVTLNVSPADDLPVAANDTFAATEDTTVSGSLAGNDTLSGDGGNAFALGTSPAHGTVVVNADGTFTYTPSANYNGPDSFTYTLTDADGDVSTATVTLNVGAVDDLPVAVNDSFAAAEDTALSGNLGTNDTLSGDGGNAFALANGPSHGTVIVKADGTYTYTPAANYNGPDSFTYTLTDADGDVSTATVTLNVVPADDLPVAVNDTFAASEDTALTGNLGSNDTLSGDGGNAFALATGPAHGTVVVNADGTFTYTPAANYNGPDSFTYTLTDADGDISTATVTLNVGAVDDLPVAANDTFTATEDTLLNGSLAGNDTLSGDGGNAFALSTGPAHGSVVVNADGTFTYTPSANYNGPDSFTYTLTDADGDVSTATVTLNVGAVNDAPVLAGESVATLEDIGVAGNVLANDSDVEGAPLSVTEFTWNGSTFTVAAGSSTTATVASVGTLTLGSDGNYAFSPADDFSGSVPVVTYSVTDGTSTHPSTLDLNVVAVADTPTLTLNSTTLVGGGSSDSGLPPSTGLRRDFYDEISLSTASAVDAKNLEIAVETNTATSTGAVTDVAIAQADFDTGDAYRYSGYIYLEAGHSYTISGNRDDTMIAKIGGNTVFSQGFNNWGTFSGDTLNVTVSGYYSFELNVFDGNGVGVLDVNMSVDGGPPVDLNTSNFHLYAGAADLTDSDAVLGDFVANNDGGYFPVDIVGADGTFISLGSIGASLGDSDGSEHLTITISGIPVGATISDGTNTFTATAGLTSVDVTAWDRQNLQFKSVAGFNGAVDLSVTATATEASNGSSASTTGSLRVVVADATPPDLFTEGALVIVNQGTSSASTYRQVAFPVVVNLADAGETLSALVVNGLPAGVVISDGTHSFTASMADNSVDVAGWNLGSLTLAVPTSFTITGTTISVTATSTVYAMVDGVNTAIDSASSSDTLTLVADYTTTSATGNAGNETLNGSSADNHISGGGGNDSVSGAAGNDLLLGDAGNDSITGGTGNDVIYGGTGDDRLDGGTEADRLIGGAGNDTLIGGTGVANLTTDVFQWQFNDDGSPGSPAADTILDFNAGATASGGDILDLRDLLVGETGGSLANYLHFSTSGTDTVISISTSGGYSGGYSSGQTDQTITLSGVDLVGGRTDVQIIQDLLKNGNLVTG